MHLIMMLVALSLAWYLRLRWSESQQKWAKRWQRSLLLFLFPPLMLLVTAVSVLCMGPKGNMVGCWDGWLSQLLCLVFLGIAVFLFLKLAQEGYHSLQQIRTYPQHEIGGKPARILNAPNLFTAYVGFWHSELVISQGMLQTLAPAHLEAVLAHEQAHYHYRDTFWFFWLGWLRQLTTWLPNTEALWEELLTLRELRADAKAAQQVDALLLAESLLFVVSYPHLVSENFCAAFSVVAPANRLVQRIDALLEPQQDDPGFNMWFWILLTLAFLPLVAVPFHC